MVIDPPEDIFPRFAKNKRINLKKVPKLAMAKLEEGMTGIQLRVGNKNFIAPIPRFPTAAIEEVKKVKMQAPNAQFHLLFMPNWKQEPIQRDPVLLAKVQGKFFKVYSWDGDRFVIESILQGSKK